jgi:hypothetical protein
MKKIILLAVFVFLGYQAVERWRHAQPAESPPVSQTQSVEQARASRTAPEEAPRGGTRLESEGTVTRVLADDTQGSRHQRFIVRLASGRTVLIAHNIDIAPRVRGISEGDAVSFAGEFEENDKGGVVHWTHHDPSGRHVAGWIRHRGQTYQ